MKPIEILAAVQRIREYIAYERQLINSTLSDPYAYLADDYTTELAARDKTFEEIENLFKEEIDDK